MPWTRHDPAGLRVDVDGERHYRIQGVGTLPSVTTVLAATAGRRWALEAWEEKHGSATTASLTAISVARGQRLHAEIEALISHGREPAERTVWWRSAETTIRQLAACAELLLCEGAVWHHAGRYAGTADMVFRMAGELAIIDWTSAAEPKTEESLDRKGIQIAGYADAIADTYDERPELGIVVVALPNRPAQVRRVHLRKALDTWRDRVAEYWS